MADRRKIVDFTTCCGITEVVRFSPDTVSVSISGSSRRFRFLVHAPGRITIMPPPPAAASWSVEQNLWWCQFTQKAIQKSSCDLANIALAFVLDKEC